MEPVYRGPRFYGGSCLVSPVAGWPRPNGAMSTKTKNMHVYTCMILPFPMGESVAFFDIPGPMVPG